MPRRYAAWSGEHQLSRAATAGHAAALALLAVALAAHVAVAARVAPARVPR